MRWEAHRIQTQKDGLVSTEETKTNKLEVILTRGSSDRILLKPLLQQRRLRAMLKIGSYQARLRLEMREERESGNLNLQLILNLAPQTPDSPFLETKLHRRTRHNQALTRLTGRGDSLVRDNRATTHNLPRQMSQLKTRTLTGSRVSVDEVQIPSSKTIFKNHLSVHHNYTLSTSY